MKLCSLVMNRTKTIAALGLVLVLVGLLSFVAYYKFSSRDTPPGQAPLVHLSEDNLENLRASFNEAAGQTRIIGMFSPT
jgi:hypothetical protein